MLPVFRSTHLKEVITQVSKLRVELQQLLQIVCIQCCLLVRLGGLMNFMWHMLRCCFGPQPSRRLAPRLSSCCAQLSLDWRVGNAAAVTFMTRRLCLLLGSDTWQHGRQRRFECTCTLFDGISIFRDVAVFQHGRRFGVLRFNSCRSELLLLSSLPLSHFGLYILRMAEKTVHTIAILLLAKLPIRIVAHGTRAQWDKTAQLGVNLRHLRSRCRML